MNRKFELLFGAALLVVILALFRDITQSDAGKTQQAESYTRYVNAHGDVVSLDDYRGEFVWIDYAAQWCSYCEAQTRTIKGLHQRYGDKVLFLTLVTGTRQVMEAPSAETARQWANRFKLEPDKVLARFSTNTLPYHILYSPSGEILYQASGLHDAPRISRLLNSFIPALNP